MFRRVSASVVTRAAPLGARFVYTPPADLVKLFETDYTTEKFPIDLVPGDSTLFAQFLFKAAEPKGQFDAILADMKNVRETGKKLPVFWERTHPVEEINELKSVNPATLFVMKWMQHNGQLGNFQEVAETYETLYNAQKKKLVAKIYVGDDKADTSAAKDAAKKMQEGTEFAKFNIEFQTVVDKRIASGFSVECAGRFYSTAASFDSKAAAGAAKDVDYTALPASPVPKTEWEDSVETEVLSRYFESNAAYDAEEARNGV